MDKIFNYLKDSMRPRITDCCYRVDVRLWGETLKIKQDCYEPDSQVWIALLFIDLNQHPQSDSVIIIYMPLSSLPFMFIGKFAVVMDQ